MSNGQYSVSMGDVLHIARVSIHICLVVACFHTYICLVVAFLVNATCACIVDERGKKQSGSRVCCIIMQHDNPKKYMQRSTATKKCQKINPEV